jgi:hypothetical protein
MNKGKEIAILATSRGGPYGCKTSKLPHFFENPLKDGVETVSVMRRPPLILRKISGTYFCKRLS